jgi:aspartyl-tRNA(Asn)/glutamyl-tRNA(Gln) amidotransferase subunit B
MKYRSEYKLIEDDARILSNDRLTSDFYEELVTLTGDIKKSCSYITTVLFALFEGHHAQMGLEDIKAETSEIAAVIKMVNADELSSTNSKIVIEKLVFEGGKASEWVASLGLKQSNDTGALEAIADAVIAESASQVADYKAGKEALFGFFVGQCMKKSAGQGNPKIFTEILKKKLS